MNLLPALRPLSFQEAHAVDLKGGRASHPREPLPSMHAKNIARPPSASQHGATPSANAAAAASVFNSSEPQKYILCTSLSSMKA